MRHPHLALAGLVLLLVPAFPAVAQQLFGDYTIHHGTMLTSRLDPEMARRYDIRRSDHRGLVTIAVRKNTGDGSEAVTADVRAVAVNLSAQRRVLTMREVDEGDAIYYLADFRIDPPETVRIQINVRPKGSEEAHGFEVSRRFHAE